MELFRQGDMLELVEELIDLWTLQWDRAGSCKTDQLREKEKGQHNSKTA